MKLIPKAIAKRLPKLYSTESTSDDHKMALLKFFGGSSWTFYVLEAGATTDPEREEYLSLDEAIKTKATISDVLFFGYLTGVAEPELCYMSLAQIASMRFPPFGLPVERDRYYRPESLATIKARGH